MYVCVPVICENYKRVLQLPFGGLGVFPRTHHYVSLFAVREKGEQECGRGLGVSACYESESANERANESCSGSEDARAGPRARTRERERESYVFVCVFLYVYM